MARFIVTEMQNVLAVRVIEAPDREAAYDLFCEGQGEPCGKDGDVLVSALMSIEPEAQP